MKPNRNLFLIAALLSVNIAAANTFVVTNTVDGAGGSLRVALSSAFDGDTIDATGVSGTNTLTLGELVVAHSVTILGPGPNAFLIVGTTPGVTNRVFHVQNASTVLISGMTISKGIIAGSFPDDSGGGILNENSTLTVSNCVISANKATWGGGIYNNGESGDATFANSQSGSKICWRKGHWVRPIQKSFTGEGSKRFTGD